MEKFIVDGQHKINGHFIPSGNKNEALAVLAATLLTDQDVILNNLPDIGDIKSMVSILTDLGVGIELLGNNKIRFSSKSLLNKQPDNSLAQKIRGSFLLLAPLLYRFGYAEIPTPGGDFIGRRRLDSHLFVLKKLGATLHKKDHKYILSCDKLVGCNIFLDEASVMATENAIMAASIAEGDTTIYNAACEPHVQGLCHMIKNMGGNIRGIGSNLLTITGVSSLGGVEHNIMSDHIEIGSMIGLAAVLRSKLTIAGATNSSMGLISHAFNKLGVNYFIEGDDFIVPAEQELVIKRDDKLRIPKIDDAPWPGFPSDLLSIMLVVATQCQGTVLFFEKLFESRLFWVDKLISMGAEIILCDPHRAVVNGPAKLSAQVITSPDIRAGMALLIAALGARGTSEIFNIEQIDRGYDKIEQKLQTLGARIQRKSYTK